jgi:hypothetical protein
MINTPTIEQRVAHLEAELERISRLVSIAPPPLTTQPWWDEVFGVFANCPAFDEVEEFGKTWRNNQPDDIE